jgi:hypothetical protein
MRHDGSDLVNANIALLRQGSEVLEAIDDRDYARPVPGIPTLRVGAHLRHVLEFYECFLDGLSSGVVDYENRRRDRDVEMSRAAGLARIEELTRRLDRLVGFDRGKAVRVYAEDAPGTWVASTAGRELQVLSSHTVHHYALIAATLQALGLPVHASFGVAPSTLRHRDAVLATEAA